MNPDTLIEIAYRTAGQGNTTAAAKVARDIGATLDERHLSAVGHRSPLRGWVDRDVASWRELRRILRRLPMTNHGRARLARRKEGMSIVAGPPDRPVMVGNVRQVGP